MTQDGIETRVHRGCSTQGLAKHRASPGILSLQSNLDTHIWGSQFLFSKLEAGSRKGLMKLDCWWYQKLYVCGFGRLGLRSAALLVLPIHYTAGAENPYDGW